MLLILHNFGPYEVEMSHGKEKTDSGLWINQPTSILIRSGNEHPTGKTPGTILPFACRGKDELQLRFEQDTFQTQSMITNHSAAMHGATEVSSL